MIGLLVGVRSSPFSRWNARGRRPGRSLPPTAAIALGLAVWSAATALTSTAGGVGSLAFWRVLVGAGEAGLPPTALR